ncbi:MAG: ABC transporter substrate-binding protein [Dehalococcoidia bacterium]|nr:ABC transporter substrate-binding protein [Dehalococcoidia bacterium]
MTPTVLTERPTALLTAPPEDATRREFISGVGAAALAAAFLAACGGDDADADAGSGTWTYESEFGPVELPRTIERIVSIDYYSPTALVDIGMLPVTVVSAYLSDPDGGAFPAGYQQAIIDSGAISIGEYWGEFDVEAILAAEPDLIIATSDFLPFDSPLREQMEQIAPIVTFTARRAGSWLTRSDGIAEILGREDELDGLRSEYEQYRDDLRERYADVLDRFTFAVFSPQDDNWGVYARDHFSVGVLQDLGAHFIDEDTPELGLDEDGYPTWLPYEQIRLLNDADIILRHPNTDEVFAALQDNPLWETLPAVQQGRVFTYIKFDATSSYGWAIQNLRDLDQLFAEIQTQVDS